MRQIEPRQPIRLFAPAKLNLGLEVLGRRPDGYHDLVTILQTVSLFDTIDLIPADAPDYTPVPGVTLEDDLVWRSLRLAQERFGIELHAEVRVKKRIPAGAGLGSGSSDAGTVLAAIGHLAGIDEESLEQAAAALGSDVPFFVRGGTALATGTGTTLRPLPDLARTWFVVLVPDVSIPAKTATLYAELAAADFSDGTSTVRQAERIERGEALDPSLLRNAFARPLFERQEVCNAADSLRRAGARTVLPTGAGPALYTIAASHQEAVAIARNLPPMAGQVFVCTTVRGRVNHARLVAGMHAERDYLKPRD